MFKFCRSPPGLAVAKVRAHTDTRSAVPAPPSEVGSGEGGDALETVCLSSPPLRPCASQSGLAASPSNARCCTGKKLNDGTQRTWFCDPESTSPHFHPCAWVCDPPPFRHNYRVCPLVSTCPSGSPPSGTSAPDRLHRNVDFRRLGLRVCVDSPAVSPKVGLVDEALSAVDAASTIAASTSFRMVVSPMIDWAEISLSPAAEGLVGQPHDAAQFVSIYIGICSHSPRAAHEAHGTSGESLHPSVVARVSLGRVSTTSSGCLQSSLSVMVSRTGT